MGSPEVRAVLFKGPKQHGDFNYMLTRDKYKNTLFLISENIKDMLYSEDPGGGTAQLRLQCYGHVADGERPAAAGIPTGWCSAGGFPAMNAQVKFAIDLSFERILVQLSTWDYEYILYSCDSDDHGLLGAGLFRTTLGEDVVQYISTKIHNLPHVLEERKKANTQQMTLERIRQKEKTWLGEQAKLTAENIQIAAYLQRIAETRKRQRGGYGML